MQTKNKINKSGFTLIELLIVVLIIGILTSVALPMYKKAAERSKATEALSTLTAVAKSEHDFFLTKNKYTQDFADLDIDLTDKNGNKAEDDAFKSQYYDYELLDSGIVADRNNGEYTLYKDYEDSQIICTPSSHYICENLGEFKKESCNKLGMAWASSNSTCYADEEIRCKDLYGEDKWITFAFENKKYCGYIGNDNQTLADGLTCIGTGNNCNNSVIGDGGVCRGRMGNSCQNSTVAVGGICEAYETHSCDYSTINGGICRDNFGGGCQYTTISNRGICEANSHFGCRQAILEEDSGSVCLANNGGYACYGVTVNKGTICKGIGENTCISVKVKEGGECWANAEGACGDYTWANTTSYAGTGATSGCCRGKYCPSNAPRCECPNHEKKDSNGNCITA